MKKLILNVFLASTLLVACNKDDDNSSSENAVTAPTTYSFIRNGATTVSFTGQTQRIKMAEELISALKNNTKTVTQLNGMFAHAVNNNDFSDATLNASSKNIRSKVANSKDFFSSNTTDATAIKAEFDSWISEQVTDVFPNWTTNATAGNPGKIQVGGGSTRYITGKGLELNQMVAKSLIGGLMTDQILNNYLSTAVLDAGDNRTENDNGTLASGKNYTTMEHKWDEAYGYLYGNENNYESPVLGADSFLNKYLLKVDLDSDFTGIAKEIFDAFKLGRAAIVAKNYTVRDEQAKIIREKISKVIAIRAVHYLQGGKANLATDKASAFHALSEGLGFVYSLQFTRKPNEVAPYFTRTEVQGFINSLQTGNGFWTLTTATLDQISTQIAAKFDFTVAQAAN